MDMALIAGAANGLKLGREILTGLMEGKVEIASQGKILEALGKLGEVQNTLFALREELFRLQSENDTLRRKNDEYESWTAKIDQYALGNTAGGAIVYIFKGEPRHYACPKCVNDRQIQILQDNRTMSGKYRCPGCENEFPVNPRKIEPPINYDQYGQ